MFFSQKVFLAGESRLGNKSFSEKKLQGNYFFGNPGIDCQKHLKAFQRKNSFRQLSMVLLDPGQADLDSESPFVFRKTSFLRRPELINESLPGKTFLLLFDPSRRAKRAGGRNHKFLPQTLINPCVFNKIGARSAPENPEFGYIFHWSLIKKAFLIQRFAFGDGRKWLLKTSPGKNFFDHFPIIIPDPGEAQFD